MTESRRETPDWALYSPLDAGLAIPQLAVAALLALTAYVLVCANAVSGEGVVRAVACGTVAGFAGRRSGDWWLAALIGLIGALGGFMAIAAMVPSEQIAAAVNESLLAAFLVAPPIAAGVCYLSGLLPGRRMVEVGALVIVIGLYLYGVGVLPGPARAGSRQLRQLIASQPEPDTWAVDAGIYLQTYWKMRQGVPFYRAQVEAFDEDKRFRGSPTGLLGMRQPWIYYLWRALPGPPAVNILDWFIAFVCATMAVSYLAARRFVAPVAALLAPIALSGYFALPSLSVWFTLSEYWAGMVAVGFVCALAYERWNLAAGLVVVGFAFRELMLFLAPIYVIAWVLGGRRRSLVPALIAATVGPFVLFGVHAYLSPVRGQTAGVSAWLNGGIKPLVEALRFSGAVSVASRWTYLAVPVAAFAGATQVRPGRVRWWLCAAVAIPVVSLAVFSSGQWGVYWGAVAQPMVMTIAPLAAVAMWPAHRPENPRDPATG